MAFPNSPSNGELATVNNIVYVYNSAKGVWNKANVAAPFYVSNVSISSLSLSAGTDTTNTITGALVVTGGIGLSGNIVAGQNARIEATTISTSATTGALVVSGGAGIAGALNVGGDLTAAGEIAVTGNILPSANVTYNLGSATQRWKDLYLSGSTIYIGGATVQTDDANVTISNPIGGSFSISGSSANQANLVAGNLTTSHTVTTSKVNNTGQFYYNSRTIEANVTIGATENAMSVGPITIADGVEVVINDGGEWSVV